MKEYIERADIKALLERYGATDDAMALIDTIPAADVAEVRHGRWIVHFDHFTPYQKCSVCGFEIPLVATENETEICLYKHCPECIARMDKEYTLDEIIGGAE